MTFLPGVLGPRTLRRTVQVRLGFEPLWLPCGKLIFTVSRHRIMNNPGQDYYESWDLWIRELVNSSAPESNSPILQSPMYLAPHDNTMSVSLRENVSKFVIPAKSRKAGREPGSRKNLIILPIHWIPDLARLGG
jgi:hypothetical protein